MDFLDLTQRQIDAVMRSFGLPSAASFARLGGWANQTYLVSTRNGREYVLKRLILQQPASLANDIAIQRQLAAAGVPAPEYVVNAQGACLYAEAGIQAVVSPKLPGVHPQSLSDDFCFAIGKTVALFHIAVHSLPFHHPGWLNPASAAAALVTPIAVPHLAAAQALVAEHRFIYGCGLPAGIIHGDIHENNVLVEAEARPRVMAVLDFEECEANLLIVDLARTLLSVCRDAADTSLLPAKMAHATRGYATVRPLADSELDLLPAALKYVIGLEVLWLHRHGFAAEAQEHLARAQSL